MNKYYAHKNRRSILHIAASIVNMLFHVNDIITNSKPNFDRKKYKKY